jgi:hypothetical protein
MVLFNTLMGVAKSDTSQSRRWVNLRELSLIDHKDRCSMSLLGGSERVLWAELSIAIRGWLMFEPGT